MKKESKKNVGEMIETKSFYIMEIHCHNCNNHDVAKIKKGIYLYEFLENIKPKCSYCGCEITNLEEPELLEPDFLED